MKKYRVTIEFTKDVLGSSVADPVVVESYIVNKMMQGRTGLSAEIAQQNAAEEIENLKKDKSLQERIEEVGDKALTVFYRNHEGVPSMAAHQIKGWIKEATAFLVQEKVIKCKALQKKDSEAVYGADYIKRWVSARVNFPDGQRFFTYSHTEAPELFDRPLRAKTMQGDRVCLASSELLPAGTQCTFEVILSDSFTQEMFSAVLNRGKLWGISQWSNAGFGTFRVVEAEVEDYQEAPIVFN